MHLFVGLKKTDIQRPVGEVDVLIGCEYAGFHPVPEQSVDNLILLRNQFGKCLSGSHKNLTEGTKKVVQHIVIHHVESIEI